MYTRQLITDGTSTDLHAVADSSIALVVTSPPYPMIEMWDDCFADQNPAVIQALESNDPDHAFSAMHEFLDLVWAETARVVMPGGIVCVNIGDATRTFNGRFQLYSNHSRIISAFMALGFCVLPDILWRKPSNAPNKFMGSGMYPPSAYVTYEHEYILVFRKGGKRTFPLREDQIRRRQSAYFWEERNIWFSDLWQLTGETQTLPAAFGRARTAAFPFEIASRLVRMFSIYGDNVLDPFAGTGTTVLACLSSGRNGIGYELDNALASAARGRLLQSSDFLSCYTETRLRNHLNFIEALRAAGTPPLYVNTPHGFAVKTRQEVDLLLYRIENMTQEGGGVHAEYFPIQL